MKRQEGIVINHLEGLADELFTIFSILISTSSFQHGDNLIVMFDPANNFFGIFELAQIGILFEFANAIQN